MKRFFQFIDSSCLRLEKKWGLGATSILVGLMLVVLAALLSTPRWDLFYHGKGFSRLSEAPFDFSLESGLRYRILSPLLGYVLFLRGALFKYLMLAFLAAFFALVYFYHRRKGMAASESFGIGALLSLSTLSFFQLFFPGYNDPVSYVLILILLFNPKRKTVVMTCLALLLFNHENTIFLFPFFFLFLLAGEYSFRKIVSTMTMILPAVIIYFVYRVIINAISEVDFDTSYYFSRENLRWTWDHVSEYLVVGIFQAFRAGWVFLLLALSINIKQKRYGEIAMLITGFAFVVSQFLIAYDISRLTGLAFPVLLLSMWRVRDYFGPANFSKVLWLLIAVNLFIPSLCIGALEPIPYPPFWWPGLKEWFLSF